MDVGYGEAGAMGEAETSTKGWGRSWAIAASIRSAMVT